MPRVKLDYIVSISNEDPENPASNLLKWDISKQKWLCNKGETTCSVVLQLVKAVQIQSVHIGAHHTALLEVLVGLSEKPNEAFEVLVPSCVLLSPSEARSGSIVERVRSFSGEQLTAARLRRVDRVRVVCSQPYNKHCKYGLSFIHVFSPETEPKSLFSLSLESYSDDEDTFRPGELFAKHRVTSAPTCTDARIRRASAGVLRSPLGESLEPSVTQIRRIGLGRLPSATRVSQTDEAKRRCEGKTAKRKIQSADRSEDTHIKKSTVSGQRDSPEREGDRNADREGGVLRGVVFALSGYQNPRRALLRDTALAMGARYQPDWSRTCTHLVCAFPNTPKLRAVRAAGQTCVAVRGEWLESCARERRRLPWRPHAVEADPPATPPSPALPDNGAESDTDDEIERVRAERRDSDATRVEEPPRASRHSHLRPDKLLPAFLEGWACAVCERVPAARRASLSRYLRAYGALVLPEEEAELMVCEGQHAHQTPALSPAWLATAHRLQEAPDPAPFALLSSV